jgi:hypothetical protein
MIYHYLRLCRRGYVQTTAIFPAAASLGRFTENDNSLPDSNVYKHQSEGFILRATPAFAYSQSKALGLWVIQ